MRLETTITDRADIERVLYLQHLLDAPGAALVREALLVYGWAVSEVQAGRKLASVEPFGTTVREFASPLLDRVSWTARERIELSPEALRAIGEAVRRPAEPTAELAELMQGEPVEEPAGVG